MWITPQHLEICLGIPVGDSSSLKGLWGLLLGKPNRKPYDITKIILEGTPAGILKQALARIPENPFVGILKHFFLQEFQKKFLDESYETFLVISVGYTEGMSGGISAGIFERISEILGINLIGTSEKRRNCWRIFEESQKEQKEFLQEFSSKT